MVPKEFNIGFVTIFPPVGASYQTTVSPTWVAALAVKVWMGEVAHSVWLPSLTGAPSFGLIVKVIEVRAVLVQEDK